MCYIGDGKRLMGFSFNEKRKIVGKGLALSDVGDDAHIVPKKARNVVAAICRPKSHSSESASPTHLPP